MRRRLAFSQPQKMVPAAIYGAPTRPFAFRQWLGAWAMPGSEKRRLPPASASRRTPVCIGQYITGSLRAQGARAAEGRRRANMRKPVWLIIERTGRAVGPRNSQGRNNVS